MKYFLHDSNAFSDEKITLLYLKFGFEAIGLFFCILEKLALQEQPINEIVLKSQLNIKKRLEKQLNFMYEIDILSVKNGDVFSKNILKFSEKYQIKKEKTRKRVSEWREKQEDTENVTRYKSVRNAHKDKISKDKISKDNNKDSFELFWDYFHENIKQLKSKKAPTFKHWQKLTIEEQRKAYKKVSEYSKSNTNHKYLSIARTYLSDKLFNDEFGTNGSIKNEVHLSFESQTYLSDEMKQKVLTGELTNKQALSIQYPES